ncbi:hypothetical protein [Glycomyces sp. NRRL B-16210]|uniref:hypothetical protein n=1 Tax=Glycomyces sp. NRRL B-16210 TaxID=1463821 RepID=UPI0004C0F7F6|nr:hypothetical protein [Glycomyces sp. NRRL B-16210]
MSGDIESLLRRGLSDIADAAPVYDEPGLADAAIAGAGRIRRRRRAGAAASGASLVVLGAAAFVWQPWFATGADDGPVAGDTSVVEARDEFAMEFVVQDDGEYVILNEQGNGVPIGYEEPINVSRLEMGYLVETDTAVNVVEFDGTEVTGYEKPEPWLNVPVNRDGDGFAVFWPDVDFLTQETELVRPATDGSGASVSFTTSTELELVDWNRSTLVFRADLWSVSGGDTGGYMFNDDHDWGLEEVASLGFEAAVVTDMTDPGYVCVSDLDPMTGTASVRESCGRADSEEIRQMLAADSGDEDAPDLLAHVVEREFMEFGEFVMDGERNAEEGDLYSQFFDEGRVWSDPQGRWQVSGLAGDESWRLMDLTRDQPELTELALPPGAVMPVLRYG